MTESFFTRNALYQGDFRDVLPKFPAGLVDLVVTDPPHNIASDHALTRAGGRVMTTREAWGAWDQYSEPEYHTLLARLFAELARISGGRRVPAGKYFLVVSDEKGNWKSNPAIIVR